MRYLSLFLIIFSVMDGHAIETDNFTKKYEPMVDAAPIINKKSNELFDEALVLANQVGACDEETLYEELRKKFRNHMFGELNKWLEQSEEVPRLEIRVKESIYRDMTAADALVLGLGQNLLNSKLGSVIRIGDVRVGTDKLEHFSGTGFSYFKKYYIEGWSIDRVLKKGDTAEGGVMGAAMTGVYAYADISANFNGMRFWNRILGTGEDPLGSEYTRTPYVRCENNVWIRQQDLDWREYADVTWDESENCSFYRKNRIKKRVWGLIHQMETEIGRSLACDQSGEVQRLLNTKYKPVKKWIHH